MFGAAVTFQSAAPTTDDFPSSSVTLGDNLHEGMTIASAHALPTQRRRRTPPGGMPRDIADLQILDLCAAT